MGHNVNAGHDDNYYADQLARYLLNAIYDLSRHQTAKRVLKRDAFESCSANGHKGNNKDTKKHSELRYPTPYHHDIERALEVLLRQMYITRNAHGGFVNITEAGKQMCEKPTEQGGWHVSNFHPDKLDPRILRLK
jgi:hypothetical protein